jgi:hypothetical protein
MPATYTLISSNVLSSSAASVTFSSIPATFTDLVIRYTTRGTAAATNTLITFNGSSASNYSATAVAANTTSAISSRQSSATSANNLYSVNRSTSTASTFSSAEIYIPSYTVSQNKPFSGMGVIENNSSSTGFNIAANALLFSDTTAISSITLVPDTGSFASDSSFYLYGISNA